LAGRDIERAGEHLRLVGHDADRVTADIGECGDEIGGPARPEFGDHAVVGHRGHHVAHVVAASRRRRHDLVEFWAEAVARIDGRSERGEIGVGGRQVAQELVDHVNGGLGVGNDGRGNARSARVNRGATERVVLYGQARELLNHRRPGHEGVGIVDHHDEVGDTKQEGGSSNDRSGDNQNSRDDARAADHRPGGGAPTVRGRDAFADVGAGGLHEPDDRLALGAGEFTCRADGERVGLAERLQVANDREAHHRTITDCADARTDCSVNARSKFDR